MSSTPTARRRQRRSTPAHSLLAGYANGNLTPARPKCSALCRREEAGSTSSPRTRCAQEGIRLKFGEISKNLPTLETDRLILRKMTLDDAEAVFAYASDPEVTRYVIWDAHRSIEDSRAFLELTVQKYESGGEPDWGIVYKGDQRFVGTCGFTTW